MDKKIVLKAMDQLIHSNEWSIVKSQLEEERRNLQNKLMVHGFSWDE